MQPKIDLRRGGGPAIELVLPQRPHLITVRSKLGTLGVKEGDGKPARLSDETSNEGPLRAREVGGVGNAGFLRRRCTNER